MAQIDTMVQRHVTKLKTVRFWPKQSFALGWKCQDRDILDKIFLIFLWPSDEMTGKFPKSVLIDHGVIGGTVQKIVCSRNPRETEMAFKCQELDVGDLHFHIKKAIFASKN